jgi:endonuclease/exonuclease/phosphatase family metal-dependent hydrolase
MRVRLYTVGGVQGRGHVIAEIDLPDARFRSDVVIVSAHFVSGGAPEDIEARAVHADALLSDTRRALSENAVSPNTSIILTGDFNAYETDERRHLDILIRGDVRDEATYGPDGSLDPEGIPMADLLPVHNATGDQTWTWRDDTQQFEPYALDRIIYSSSNAEVIHGFVLNTAIMSPEALTRRGLEAGDVALDLESGVFDHLPLVADIRVD